MRKCLSLVLVMALLLSTVALFSVNAEENDLAQTQANPTINSDAGGIAPLLANAVETSDQEQGDITNCITDLKIEGKTATVELNNDQEVRVIVAVYDDETNAMMASGIADAEEKAGTITIQIDTDVMPEYYIAKAFLLDINNKPLNAPFENIEYTKAHQEFLEKTVQDFEGEEVLNLDQSDNNNFAVFQDNVIKVIGTQMSNVLVSADETTKTYEFSNVDDTMSALKKGDKLYYTSQTGDYSIILISKITINGNKLTVVGEQEVALDDIFTYVKIDATGESGSEADDALAPIGSNRDKEIAPVGWEVKIFDKNKPYSHEFNFNEKLNEYCKLTGSVSFKVTASIKAYLYDDRLTATVKLDQEAKFNVTLSGAVDKKIDLGDIDIPVAAGVSVGMDIVLKLKADGYVSFTATETCTVGFTLDTSKEKPTNISKPPEFTHTDDIKINVYIGLEISPNVALFDDVFKVGISGELGVNINVSKSEKVNSDQEKHLCQSCLVGKVTGKITVDLNLHVDFKVVDDYDWNKNLFTKDGIKIFDFYISEKGHGIGTCPNRSYRVKILVVDSAGKPVPKAMINFASINGDYVGTNGVLEKFYLGGTHKFTISKSGYNDRNLKLKVNGPVSAVYTLYKDGEDTSYTWDSIGNGTVIDSVKNSAKMKVYFSNDLNWDNICAYTFNEVNGEVIEYFGSWPGIGCDYVGNDIWSVNIPVDCSHIVFSSGGDTTNQSSDVPNPGISMMAVKGEGFAVNGFGHSHPVFKWVAIPYGVGDFTPGSQATDQLVSVGASLEIAQTSETTATEPDDNVDETEIEVQKYTLFKEDLVPDEDYLAMVVAGSSTDYTVDTSSLLYVSQGTTDSNGKLQIDYYCKSTDPSWVVLLFGPCDHEPGEWKTVLNATETDTGLKVQSCTRCGEILETETIPKIDGSQFYTVYFVDSVSWGFVNIHYWQGDVGTQWPGEAMTYVEDNEAGQKIYSFELPIDVDGVVFNGVDESHTGNHRQTLDVLSEDLGDNRVYYPNGQDEYLTGNTQDMWYVDYYTKEVEDDFDIYVLGDANLDGKVNVRDSTLIQKYVASLETLDDIQLQTSDVNADSKVNVRDATAIQKYVADIETGLLIGSEIKLPR